MKTTVKLSNYHQHFAGSGVRELENTLFTQVCKNGPFVDGEEKEEGEKIIIKINRVYYVQSLYTISFFQPHSSSDLLPNNPPRANPHQHPAMNIGLADLLLQRREVCVSYLLDSLLQDSLRGVASLELLHEGNIERQTKDVIVAHFCLVIKLATGDLTQLLPRILNIPPILGFCQLQRLHSYILEGEALILFVVEDKISYHSCTAERITCCGGFTEVVD